MQHQLIKIDSLIIKQRHRYLSAGDQCYYIMDYPPYSKYGRTPINSLIMDFKIGVEKKGTADWQDKLLATKKIAEIMDAAVPKFKDGVILIPMPPSKHRHDERYDDRLMKLLEIFCANRPETMVFDIISGKRNLDAAHLATNRPTPQELLDNYELDETVSLDGKIVVLIDDVITDGAHFYAAKNLILSHYPTASITGLFIASTIK